MTAAQLTVRLKEEAARLGFDLVGAAPAVTPPGIERFRDWLERGCAAGMEYVGARAGAYEHPRHVLEGARSILMLGMDYRTDEPAACKAGQGRVSRYAWGQDYHDVVHQRLKGLARVHRQLAPQARVRGIVDTAPLLEREFGRLAGLGWFGKNTVLLNRRMGSWFFLAALLTTELLEYDQPHATSHCGTCRACLDACPTGALVEPHRLDARKCLSYWLIESRDLMPAELRSSAGAMVFGCDICQEVCPWNRRPGTAEKGGCPDFRVVENGTVPVCARADAPNGTVPEKAPFQPAPGMNPVNLADWFALDDDAFRRRFRHTPLWRAKRRGALRNAAVVLGNRPCEPALDALVQGLGDREPVVRAACAWALGRYGQPPARRALEDQLDRETDPTVIAELRAALG